MKNVFLIGDSIRFGATGSPGYGVYVKEKLENAACVYAPDENCRFAQYTLRYLHEWAATAPKEAIDVVHWNNGLWDVLRLFEDEPFTDIDYYGETLKRIYARIRFLFPRAKVIFALSTAVKEEWGSKDFFRYNRDIERYNQKAIEVLSPLGVEINDLYTVTQAFDDSLRSDWVHYGEEGSEILAKIVVERILKAME
jgi:hypothetical protein